MLMSTHKAADSVSELAFLCHNSSVCPVTRSDRTYWNLWCNQMTIPFHIPWYIKCCGAGVELGLILLWVTCSAVVYSRVHTHKTTTFILCCRLNFFSLVWQRHASGQSHAFAILRKNYGTNPLPRQRKYEQWKMPSLQLHTIGTFQSEGLVNYGNNRAQHYHLPIMLCVGAMCMAAVHNALCVFDLWLMLMCYTHVENTLNIK